MKNSKLKMVRSGLVGAAIGVAAGIVLAPESGKKFRSDIKKKSVDIKAYLKPKLKKLEKKGKKEYTLFVKNIKKTSKKVKKEIPVLVSSAKKVKFV
jgi:gas vesicle protein